MLKKIIAISFLILVLGGVVFLYFHSGKEEVPVSSVVKAIPIDASFILESRKTLPLWQNISQHSSIWKDLLAIPYFSGLNSQLKYLDSIIRDNPEIGNILESQPLFISAHISGMNRFNYLFICSVSGAAAQSLSTYLDSLKENKPVNDLHYEETTIHCVKIDRNNAFYYAISRGAFISSFSSALVEESLRQLESGISLLDNAYFTKALNVSGGQSATSIFINFQTFAHVASQLFNKSFQPVLSSIQNFGEWMELDITSNPDELSMTGFTNCDSTGSQFLNLFQSQSAQEINAASIAPANTAFMLCHELSDYERFHRNYIQYTDIHDRNRAREEWIGRIQQKYGLNIGQYFYPWISKEVAQIITEPSNSALQDDEYVLIESNNIKVAINKLSALADTIAVKNRRKTKTIDSIHYIHHEIHNLNLDNVTRYILGSAFDMVTGSWFTSAGNYVVFANSPEALKKFIYKYEGGNTLGKDPYYKNYIKQHVETESGIYVYNNIALSPIIYANYLDLPYAANMKKYKSVFSKFYSVSLQFNYTQGMFYTSIYLKGNPLK